jgi:hypothetical protein
MNWPANNPFDGEGGSALSLYDGTVLILGATGFNVSYNDLTRTLFNVAPIPVVPVAGVQGNADESNQVVMPTGNVLVAANTGSLNYYRLYEYSPGLNAFTDVSVGGPDFVSASPSPGCTILQTPLPDGTVLVGAICSPDTYIYSPPGPQVTTGASTITNITGPVGSIFTLTGTGLNGLTNGSNRDDEGHNYTSFPVISVTKTSGEKRYCRIVSVSTSSIDLNAQGSVQFMLPSGPGWPPQHDTLTFRVSASGLQGSNSWAVAF